ncbi:MAG: hypothetical protein OEZ22_08405 [Spirochaetia bacterium]|nr:hypothetical protein [Spirochaetia bacterium]
MAQISYPSYIKLYESGELKKRAAELWRIYEKCVLCLHACQVNRLEKEKGICQSTAELVTWQKVI